MTPEQLEDRMEGFLDALDTRGAFAGGYSNDKHYMAGFRDGTNVRNMYKRGLDGVPDDAVDVRVVGLDVGYRASINGGHGIKLEVE